jgi:hypothetical protein
LAPDGSGFYYVEDNTNLQTYSLTLKNHRFAPTEIHVPNGKPFFVSVKNLDDTADEFVVHSPPVEKAIPPGEAARRRPLQLQRRLPFQHGAGRDHFRVRPPNCQRPLLTGPGESGR